MPDFDENISIQFVVSFYLLASPSSNGYQVEQISVLLMAPAPKNALYSSKGDEIMKKSEPINGGN